MSKSTRGARVAGIAGLAVSLSLGVAAPAFAVPDFAFDRIGGEDRYQTAALVADEYDELNADAILANAQPGYYADALSGNYLSGEKDAPILLTKLKGIPQYTLDQLKEMQAKNVWVVGGEGVVPEAQIDQLEQAGYNVRRVAGDDRFLTNAEVIQAGGSATDNLGLIATGVDFPDALAGGPLSYQGHPVGLSTEDDIKQEVIDALKAAGVNQVLVLGGTSVVGSEVVAKLAANGITMRERLAGSDRSATAREVADYAVANLGFSKTGVNVASGYTLGYGADALAGGPLTGKQDRPMLITRTADNPGAATLDYLADNCETLADGVLFGQTGAISAAAESQMNDAATCTETPNADFTVNPSGAASLTPADPDDTTDDRTYTVAGLDDTKTYTVSLFPCENVTQSAGGVYTFKDTDATADKADGEGTTTTSSVPEADITRANSQDITDTDRATVNPVNGTINFTIDGVAPGCVVPVVYVDAGTPGLDLNASNQPTEDFGVGGQTTYLAPEAGNGTFGPDDVQSVDKANNRFVAGDLTYNYDGNDQYFVGLNSVGLDAFEAALSSGDSISGNYATDPGGVSTFTLSDNNPGDPTSVEAEKGTTSATSNDITVSVVIPGGTDYDSVVIERAPVTGGTDENADGTVGTYAVVATATTDADPATAGSFEYVDNNVPVGVYRYRAALVNDGDQGGYTADDENESSVAPTAGDTTAPTSTDVRVGTNTGSAFVLDTGDTFVVTFSEAMGALADGDTIRVTDTDGTVVDFVRSGGNFTFNGTNTVLTVTKTATDPVVAAGTLAGLGIPADITAQSGLADTAGNPWNIAGSADKTIDSE